MPKKPRTVKMEITLDGKSLGGYKWDLTTLAKIVAKASRRSGASNVLLARDLACIGDDAGDLVSLVICKALELRAGKITEETFMARIKAEKERGDGG